MSKSQKGATSTHGVTEPPWGALSFYEGLEERFGSGDKSVVCTVSLKQLQKASWEDAFKMWSHEIEK